MDEDVLSPLLGRLIDAAKSSVLAAGTKRPVEAVALLLDDDTVVSAHAPVGSAGAGSSAAEAAMAAKRQSADERQVVAAAVALSGLPAGVSSSEETRRALAALDPNLPLVVKERGRWIVRPLSRFTSPA